MGVILYKILDVGSGDLESDFHIFLNKRNTIHLDILKNAYHVEINADTHKLPFKDNSFNLVMASHILEHINNPLEALKEFKRVATSKVIIKVPNASRYFQGESEEHIYSWNQHTFNNILSKVFSKIELSMRTRLKTRNKITRLKNLVYTALFRPNQLYAICYLGGE